MYNTCFMGQYLLYDATIFTISIKGLRTRALSSRLTKSHFLKIV